MGQIKQTLQKQIDSSAKQKFFSTSGTILEYDKLYNVAAVRYLNPNGEGYVIRRNVPVSSTLGGLSNGGVMPSQECTLSFVNGNMYSPIIIGVTTSTYNSKESSDQGAFLIDESIRSVTKPENISPMGEDWIDADNQDVSKYQNELMYYNELDVNNASFEALMNLSHFSETEQGMTHLETHSNMKMKDNGDIEIFVSDNVGIRISKATKKIYLYGFDVNINGEIDLMEIIDMIKNFKCCYEPVECQCDMDFIRQSLDAINARLSNLTVQSQTPHSHNISDAVVQVGYQNNGRLHPTSGIEVIHATIIGGDADDGCPVEKRIQCSGAKSITKTSANEFDIEFDNPGFYVIIAITEDSYEELRVGTATVEIAGPDGERGGSGQFTGTTFDSGWIDVDILNGCYIDSYHYDMTIRAGHSCSTDRIAIIGKKTDGSQVVICDLFNKSNRMTPYNGDIMSLQAGNLSGEVLWQDDGNLSLADDIRQIKYIARTDSGHETCMPGADINFSMTFKFDKSLWTK